MFPNVKRATDRAGAMSRMNRILLWVSTIAWVAAGLWALVVHGVLDSDHLWAPYMGVLLFGPFWVVGGWAATRAIGLARGRHDPAGDRRWASATAAFGWIASIPFLGATAAALTGDPFATINPEGFGLVGATAIVSLAAVRLLRSARTATPPRASRTSRG
ncbi:MAG: hypothetical protein RL338_841 [Chloroflexota bacterium]